MDTESKISIIKSFAQEIINENELRALFDSKSHPVAYDGFEPSGRLHIAQGLVRAINVNKMTSTGCKFKILLADWHAWANNKMGGDLDKIQTMGKYFIEVWGQCGMDLDNVEFVWVSDFMHNDDYLKRLMQIARNTTVKRIIKSSQIMGRSESDSLQTSQIFYPVMQMSDIYQLGVDICQLGMDQRKVNMLAREIGPKIGLYAPIAVHHPMLMGLGQPPAGEKTVERAIEMKMSKSNPDTAIFMSDNEEEIIRKIRKAYCPEKVIVENPVLEYCKFIVFESAKSLKIERPAKFGGDVEFNSYIDLEKSFAAGDVHPVDLKNTVAVELNKLLKPVRDHFEKNKKAHELYELVKSYNVTK
ncbi:MAG: tyrosine--tRNA ligase [Candidatus Woesearchaeota archaeon]